jgi:lipoyl-dependent peroxiredoxin
MDEMAVTRAARVERPEGKTSSEELLAAAHALCYAMALAHTLTGKGALKEGLTVEAVATLDEERLRISAVDLDVRGSVAGPSEEDCGRLAQEAEKAFPVSNAIRANVEMRLRANFLED